MHIYNSPKYIIFGGGFLIIKFLQKIKLGNYCGKEIVYFFKW